MTSRKPIFTREEVMAHVVEGRLRKVQSTLSFRFGCMLCVDLPGHFKDILHIQFFRAGACHLLAHQGRYLTDPELWYFLQTFDVATLENQWYVEP